MIYEKSKWVTFDPRWYRAISTCTRLKCKTFYAHRVASLTTSVEAFICIAAAASVSICNCSDKWSSMFGFLTKPSFVFGFVTISGIFGPCKGSRFKTYEFSIIWMLRNVARCVDRATHGSWTKSKCLRPNTKPDLVTSVTLLHRISRSEMFAGPTELRI
jgi:hypothetical protein